MSEVPMYMPDLQKSPELKSVCWLVCGIPTTWGVGRARPIKLVRPNQALRPRSVPLDAEPLTVWRGGGDSKPTTLHPRPYTLLFFFVTLEPRVE